MTQPRHLDTETITAALSPAAAVDAISRALSKGYDPAGDTARTSAHTKRGHFLLMPSEVGDVAGVKVATVAPGNPALGFPRIQASYLLFDARTLTLRATFDGTALTTLRTPAVSIAAIRPLLGRFAGPLRVVVFGAGPQAVGHVHTLAAVAPEPLASVTFLLRTPGSAPRHVHELGEVVRIGSADADAALAQAQVVICATSARTPLFPAEAIPLDAVVVAVGSHEPDARELDSALLRRASVIVEDVETALREAGDVILAVGEGALSHKELITMRRVITGAVPVGTGQPVVFKSVGMSWQDLVVADAALRSADLPQ